MILGVSQRLFPNFYGLRVPSRRVSLAALVGINVAVVGEAVSLIQMRGAAGVWAGVWYASVMVLIGSVMALLINWRIFAASPSPDRSLKFLRMAYLWLLASLAMLVLLPVYQHGLLARLAPDSLAAQIGFSHAYSGAARHAITVGIISLMIVGVAAKIVPTLNGVDVHRLSRLWLPFVLINTGCALRVLTQIATDFSTSTYPLSGISGLLEVTGLALWGAQMWSIMAGRARLRPEGTKEKCGCHERQSKGTIVAGDRVADVLNDEPALLNTFVSFGFAPLASPVLRRTLAPYITIETACRHLGVEIHAFLAALNQARRPQRTNTRSCRDFFQHSPACAPCGRRLLLHGMSTSHPITSRLEAAVMSVRVILTAVEGALKGQQFIFTGKTQRVGRSAACELHVPGEDCSVSRRHCLLDINESSVVVRDLGSLNGTYLNRELIGQRDKRLNAEEVCDTPQPSYSLENCDELRVGDITFHVQIDTDVKEEQGEPEETTRGGTEIHALACI